MAPNDMQDDLWKDVLEGRKKVKELCAQLVQMQTEHEKVPSTKLNIVDNFLRNAARKRPAPTAPPRTPTGASTTSPTTPAGASKSARSETPGTHASGGSNLTEFSNSPPMEVGVPTPTKKKKGVGYGLCAVVKLCVMPFLALERGCFSPCVEATPKHTCNECKGVVHSPLCAAGEGLDLICKLCNQ
jgi:hypothetical protein